MQSKIRAYNIPNDSMKRKVSTFFYVLLNKYVEHLELICVRSLILHMSEFQAARSQISHQYCHYTETEVLGDRRLYNCPL